MNNVNQPNKPTSANTWSPTEDEVNSLDWCAPTSSTIDGVSTSYSKTVVDNDGWEVSDNNKFTEQLSTADDGAVELCKLLRRVGPRRFYALLDLWGMDLTDEIRAELRRLEACNCGLDDTIE